MSTFHFHNPLFFLLFLGLPFLIWWHFRRRKVAVRFSSLNLFRSLPRGRAFLVKAVLFSLQFLVVVLLILALARPRWPDPGSRIPTQGISMAIVLDVSGSMAEQDYNWKGENILRLEAAKRIFKLFVSGGEGPERKKFKGRSNDRISLTVFAKHPESVCPLTLNHPVLLKILQDQEPRTVPTESDTNIGDAIVWALKTLQVKSKNNPEPSQPKNWLYSLWGSKPDRKGDQVLVLLSDGEHNVGKPALTPRQAAQLAGNLGMRIYVIDAAKEPVGEGREFQRKKENRARAKEILQEVAKITRGQYFSADDTAGLLKVTEEIDELERARMPSWIYRRYHEGYPWFILAAFLLFSLVLTLQWTVWRSLP